MEDESTGSSGIINWLARLTRKATSGKIVPMYYGENLPPAVADSVRDARALWIILLSVLSLTLLTGAAFPLMLFVLARPLFPTQANGSLATREVVDR